MAGNAEFLWNASEVLSALILLGALVLMVKFYEEYLEVGIEEMRNWKQITIGFAVYIALKTHVTVLSNAFGVAIPAYPWYVVGLFGLILILASSFVFVGFYGLVKDYL